MKTRQLLFTSAFLANSFLSLADTSKAVDLELQSVDLDLQERRLGCKLGTTKVFLC